MAKKANKLTPYLERLKFLKEQGVLSRNHRKLKPDIVFLDTPQGVSRVGDAIAQGWPVVTDYGSTYGTAFPPGIREAVAAARGETPPLATVSLVTFRDIAYRWMDTKRIHPEIVEALNENKFDVLTGISFIRFACTDECRDTLGPHYVNPDQEVQVFIVPDNEPLMSYLRSDHNIVYYAVRSSNIAGSQEEAFAPGARRYAAAIGAPLLAVRSLKAYQNQVLDSRKAKKQIYNSLLRPRFGSQPIIGLPTRDQDAVLTLVRAGNTEPGTMQKLVSGIVSEKIGFVYVPEKTTTFTRPMYEVHEDINDPQKIRQILLEQSGL